jgi:hypothetical protein
LISFLASFAFAYLAAALLASGAGHLLGFIGFRDLVRAHTIVPQRLATPVALCVLSFELVAGTIALLLAVRRGNDVGLAFLLCAATTAAGLGFVLYVRRLLQSPTAVACGCSPLTGPTTPASLIPGAALLVISAIAVVVVALAPAQGAAGEVDGLVGVLPQLWGVTLAGIVMLVPASMPAPAVTDRIA